MWPKSVKATLPLAVATTKSPSSADSPRTADTGSPQKSPYNLIKGAPREGSFTGGDEIVMPMGDLVLMPGQYLTVEDVNAVDAADTFEIAYQADK